jgi:hypothetical protein
MTFLDQNLVNTLVVIVVVGVVLGLITQRRRQRAVGVLGSSSCGAA